MAAILSRGTWVKMETRHRLHISHKTRMLREMITITTFHMRLIKRFVLFLKYFHIRLNEIFDFGKKHPRRYGIMCQNWAGSGWQHRTDSHPILAPYVFSTWARFNAYYIYLTHFTHFWHICDKKLVHCLKRSTECYTSCLSLRPVYKELWYGKWVPTLSLQWRHNARYGVSNDQPHDCFLMCLFRCRSKKASKFRVTGLCAENSPLTGEFLAQRASNAENLFIWWHHNDSKVRECSCLLTSMISLCNSWKCQCITLKPWGSLGHEYNT